MVASIMIQGTGSNVGKSLIVAGLGRCLTDRGLKVRPFKPQNMSNNAAVTVDGGEIGRAQALQARACRTEARTAMNPVLLKPESGSGAQVVLNGKRLHTVEATEYAKLKSRLLPEVMRSFNELSDGVDVVIVEGAGSPAEINLRNGDIANMGFAEAAGVPVILVGDIDRGGVIAQIVGTRVVLPPFDRQMVKGFIVNKFRGNTDLFESGLAEIETLTGWRSFGVLPWFDKAEMLPAEDSASVVFPDGGGACKIVVPVLSRMANLDDLDPLRMEPGVCIDMITPGTPIPADARLVILTGTKSTMSDLEFLRTEGWDIDILAHFRRGGIVLGICGGYQMLGKAITDRDGIEGNPGTLGGLGLLDLETEMRKEKTTRRVEGRHLATGSRITGYEIHIGRTTGPDEIRPWLEIDGMAEGSVSADGRVMGCYVHGLFASDEFRRAFLSSLGASTGEFAFEVEIESTLDALASHVCGHVDIDRILKISGCSSQ